MAEALLGGDQNVDSQHTPVLLTSWTITRGFSLTSWPLLAGPLNVTVARAEIDARPVVLAFMMSIIDRSAAE